MSDNGPDTPPISHKWQPIEDLPENWRDLCRPDLHAVHRQWVADRKLLDDEGRLHRFEERRNTQWAIETGLIERIYTVDRGVTRALLERDLIEDQRLSLGFLEYLVSGTRDLSSSYIKELHQGLTSHQDEREVEDRFGKPGTRPVEKGAWKKWNNFPTKPDGTIHMYCPPEQVQSEMDRLVAWHEEHSDVCPEVEAAWLHHRFTQIHPFEDGNGRVARTLASAVFAKADFPILLIRDREHLEHYYDALEEADSGDLKPLVDLFADVQRFDLHEAIKNIRSLLGEESVQAIEAAAVAARQSQDATMPRVAGALDDLTGVASARFEAIAAQAQGAFESQGVVVSASVISGDTNDASWVKQSFEAVGRHGVVDLDRPSRWVSLRLGLPARPEGDIRLVVALYSEGGRPRQYAASEVLLTHPQDNGEWTSRSTTGSPFRFDVHPSDSEASEAVAAEFRVWLEGKITHALRTWADNL